MSYATQADLVTRYTTDMLVDLTDREQPLTGEINADTVERALADSDAVINGYIKGRYKLPLATTPALLRELAEAVAIYKLHRDAVSEKIRTDYTDALKILQQISAGVVRLDVEGIEPESSGATGVRTTDRIRPLTPENMKGFI